MTKLKVVKAIATDREWKGKKLWKAELSDGVTYDIFITDPNPLLGQEVEVEISESEYGPKAKILTKKAEGSGGFKGGFQKQAHDPATMVLAYAKDITIAMMETKMITTKTDVQLWIKDNYEFMTGLLPKADKP